MIESIFLKRYNVNMETCQRKVNAFAVTRSVYLMGLFDWKLVKEEKKDNAPSTLYFERDDSVPYYQEMVEIEKEISPKLIPFWVLIIPVALAFALITVALLLSLLKVTNFTSLQFFLIFFVPASLFLTLDVVIFYLRSKQLLKYLKNEEQLVKNAEEKMSALRKRYGSQE